MYSGHFLDLWGILSILNFQGYFENLLGFVDILVIF